MCTPLTLCPSLIKFITSYREEVPWFILFCWLFVQTDPFNRSHLTVDMLIPDDELKAKIDEFVRSQEMKKHGLSLQSSKATIQTTNGEMLID